MCFLHCHPMINLVFYLGAIFMGMCFTHPVFQLCALLLSLSYYVLLFKENRLRKLLGMSVFFLMIALGNPLFNDRGESLLFTWINGRGYFLEALYYGISMGAMFVTVILWFSTYQQVMTSDKLLYCFGNLAPAFTMILTMVFRFIPDFQKKILQITAARKGIGKWQEEGKQRTKIEQGLLILSLLTSQALEHSIVTADSMKSRGFGSGKSTAFSIFQIKKSETCLLFLMFVLLLTILLCALAGGMSAVYFPWIELSSFGSLPTSLGFICYAIFLSIPTV